jgi:hypothetical protein
MHNGTLRHDALFCPYCQTYFAAYPHDCGFARSVVAFLSSVNRWPALRDRGVRSGRERLRDEHESAVSAC